MSLRAAGYRRSNDGNLSNQEEKIRAYCEEHGLTLTHIYRDLQSTALHLRRNGLQAMLSDAREGYFEVVVACDTSRLSRRLSDLYKIQNLLRECQIALCLCSDDRQTAFRSEQGDWKAYSSKPPKL